MPTCIPRYICGSLIRKFVCSCPKSTCTIHFISGLFCCQSLFTPQMNVPLVCRSLASQLCPQCPTKLTRIVWRNLSVETREPCSLIAGKSPKWSLPEEAVSIVKTDDHIFLHGCASTPRLLISALVEHGKKRNLRNVRLYHIPLFGEIEFTNPECREIFRSNSLFIGANCRDLVNAGHGDYTPVFVSDVPTLFTQGILKLDVAIVQISPANKHGYHSLGPSVDIARSALKVSKHLIGLVNPNVPITFGQSLVHTSHFDTLVEGNEELPDIKPPTPSSIEKKIGNLIAENLVGDGATLQMGIGSIPDAVLAELTNHKDLGIHTEMFSDGLVDLCRKGIVTNRLKKMNPGFTVSSFLFGSKRLYEFVDQNPSIKLFCVKYTNDEFVIAHNPKPTSINSCLEVDLFGNVCSDSIGSRMYSGFGGQVDFMRGAAKSIDGLGKPILAMPSTTTNGDSKISLSLKPGAGVMTTRAHCHYIVTEYGVACLFGKNNRQRAHALIQIAHPDHREFLERSAYQRMKCMPSPD